MNKQIKELLNDCKESLEWITEQEEWETLQEGSSVEDLIKEIEEVLDETI
jgi:hypothetical protein